MEGCLVFMVEKDPGLRSGAVGRRLGRRTFCPGGGPSPQVDMTGDFLSWGFPVPPVSPTLLWTTLCFCRRPRLLSSPSTPHLPQHLIRAAEKNWKPSLPRCSSYKKGCFVWPSCCHCWFSWPMQDFELLSCK